MSMRPGPINSGDTAKFMIMSAISQRDGRTGYALDLVMMSVINGGKGKISVGMRDPGRCWFRCPGILMAVSIVERGNPAKAVNMNRPPVPGRNVKSVGMQRVRTIRSIHEARNRYIHEKNTPQKAF
jgi:hypothetical protein